MPRRAAHHADADADAAEQLPDGTPVLVWARFDGWWAAGFVISGPPTDRCGGLRFPVSSGLLGAGAALVGWGTSCAPAGRPPRPSRAPVRGAWPRLVELHDLLVAALVMAMRRVRELGQVIDARSAGTAVHDEGVHVRIPDAAVCAVAAVAVVLMTVVLA